MESAGNPGSDDRMVRSRACAKPDPDTSPNDLRNRGCLSNADGVAVRRPYCDAVCNANGDADSESIASRSVSRSKVASTFSDTVFRSKRGRCHADAGCELYRLAKPKRYRKPITECQRHRDAERYGYSASQRFSEPRHPRSCH